MIWITAGLATAVGLFALQVLPRRRPATVWAFEAAAEPVVHRGADETWHPALEVAAPTPAAVAPDAGLDLDAQLLLADFDALIESWRVDPDWLTEWRATVDVAYADAGAATETHHRWRYATVDVPTAEYRCVPAPDGAL